MDDTLRAGSSSELGVHERENNPGSDRGQGLIHLLHVVLEHHGLGRVLELQAQGHLVERRLILGATLLNSARDASFLTAREASAPKPFSLIVKIPFSYRPDMTLAAEVRVSTRELNVFARKA